MSAYSGRLVFVGERRNPGDVLAQRPSGVFKCKVSSNRPYKYGSRHTYKRGRIHCRRFVRFKQDQM